MEQALAYATLGVTVSLAVLRPRLGWRDLRFTPGRRRSSVSRCCY